MKPKAYIQYRGEKVEVKVLSTFPGADGLVANVEAVTGFPFLSTDVQSQGKTSGAWSSNGYRVRADFVIIDDADKLHAALKLMDSPAYLSESGEQPHPVEVAYELEQAMDAEFEDDWCYDNGLFDTRPYHTATSDGEIPF